MKKQIKTLAIIFVLILTLAISATAAGANISDKAKSITASSEYAEKYSADKCAHELDPEHDTGIEWASAGEMNPWIKFEYASPVWINKIILSDRNNMVDWSKIITITFSDGSNIVTGELDDAGAPYTVDFEPKNITWVQFDVTVAGDETLNNGFGRISIYDCDPPVAPAPDPVPEPVVEAAPVVVEAAPAPVAAVSVPAAPQTSDNAVLIIMLLSVAAVISFKVARKAKKI